MFRKKLLKTCVVALCLLVGVSSAERYKDRSFKVTKRLSQPFAKDVPALSNYHSLTVAMLAYKAVKDDATVAYFYNNEHDTKEGNLLLDLYLPDGDTIDVRPAVIVSHGGAFVAGARNDFAQHTVNYCDSLAARGFVAASIEYRLGVSLTSIENYTLHIDSTDFARSVYRGVQDIRAAVRYLRANAKRYHIDPDRIYLIGNSAGAIISLENIYVDSEEDFPSYVHKASNLGALDLYGEQGYSSRANGAIALWGAVHDPSIIRNDIPVMLIHGTGDGTVLFKEGRPLSNIAGVLQNLIPSEMVAELASYKLDLHAPTLYGSYVIDSILTEKGVEHSTYFVEGKAHEFYDEAPYTDTVQTKVFDFLYKLTQSKPVVSNPPLMLTRASNLMWGEDRLSFSIGKGSNVEFKIMNLRGQQVHSGRVSAGQQVDLNLLENGVYLLSVKGERPVRFGIRK